MRILNQLHGDGSARIRARFPDADVVDIPLKGPLPADLQGDVLLYLTAQNGAEAVQRAPWVHVLGTGVNFLPQEAFLRPLLTCGRGYGAVPISEFALALMLAFEKRLPQTWINQADQWQRFALGRLAGRTLGIIGFGAIGEAVARRALAFDMQVLAIRRHAGTSATSGVEIVASLAELLPRCDHVVVSAPLTDLTRGMLNDEAFALMRRGVHLVNVSRGAIVDSEALRRALDGGQVAMASLDAFDVEPIPDGHWMLTHPKVRASPHVAWSSPEGADGLLELFFDNVERYRTGLPLNGQVDRDERY